MSSLCCAMYNKWSSYYGCHFIDKDELIFPTNSKETLIILPLNSVTNEVKFSTKKKCWQINQIISPISQVIMLHFAKIWTQKQSEQKNLVVIGTVFKKSCFNSAGVLIGTFP